MPYDNEEARAPRASGSVGLGRLRLDRSGTWRWFESGSQGGQLVAGECLGREEHEGLATLDVRLGLSGAAAVGCADLDVGCVVGDGLPSAVLDHQLILVGFLAGLILRQRDALVPVLRAVVRRDRGRGWRSL